MFSSEKSSFISGGNFICHAVKFATKGNLLICLLWVICGSPFGCYKWKEREGKRGMGETERDRERENGFTPYTQNMLSLSPRKRFHSPSFLISINLMLEIDFLVTADIKVSMDSLDSQGLEWEKGGKENDMF